MNLLLSKSEMEVRILWQGLAQRRMKGSCLLSSQLLHAVLRNSKSSLPTLADETAMALVWEAATDAVWAKLAACEVPTAAVAVAEALEEYLLTSSRTSGRQTEPTIDELHRSWV